MVTMEGATTLSGDDGRPTEAERAKPALPGAGPEPKTTRKRSRSGCREGNHSGVFSTPVVTGLAATRRSSGRAVRRPSCDTYTHLTCLAFNRKSRARRPFMFQSRRALNAIAT